MSKLTKTEMKIAAEQRNLLDWEARVTSSVYEAAKVRALANDSRAPAEFREMAEAEMEAADRLAKGNIAMMEASITAINVLRGMSADEAKAEAEKLARVKDAAEQEETTDDV